MKITKFGHCCMLIEEKNVRILTDPGTYSTSQNVVKNIHFVLITHEHPDHLHIDSLKTVINNNPNAIIITNKAVGALLDKQNIKYTIVEDGDSLDLSGVLLEGFGKEHAVIYKSIPTIQNTGYFIGNKLFYPGDSFTNPNRNVDILCLPVAGPWMKLSEAIDYAIELKPSICIPVHEGILKVPGGTHMIPPKILEPMGIKFMVLELDKETEIL
ncbi:MAG: MBL fold metallo-hydrolase [bacterium]